MARRHTIEQGDSVSRLAELYGFAPDTIWNEPANEELRALRIRMDVLLPGDEVVIPDLRVAEARCSTGATHRFRRRGVPMLFEMQLFDGTGVPAGDRPFRLVVDGAEHAGRTDVDLQPP